MGERRRRLAAIRGASRRPGYQITPQQRAFWSFQPIKNPVPPQARLDAWKRNAIDTFILAKLDENKLSPPLALPS